MTFERIPDELTALPQWVGWRVELRHGKQTKVPYDPRGRSRHAKCNDPLTWGSYSAAFVAVSRGLFDGLGFVFSELDPYCGIDLDKVYDSDRGEMEDVLPLLDRFSTYAEWSPSGRGIHLILRGVLPDGRGRKRGQFEIYDRLRFFTMTGSVVCALPIRNAQAELDAWYRETFPEPVLIGTPRPISQMCLSDAELVERIRASEQAAKFDRLWAGDPSEYISHSEADLALCDILVWWTNHDLVAVDRLFRQSGLFRDKWERADYRRMTLAKAHERVTGGYQTR